MKRGLLTFLIFAVCFCLQAQKMTELTEATVVDGNALMWIRAGSTGDLIKKISIANLFKSRIFTGTITLPATTSIGNISATEIGHLNNVNANIQDQIDDIFTGTITLPATTSIGNISATEIDHLNNVNANIQDQIDDIEAGKGVSFAFEYDYYVENIDGTYYARPNPGSTLSAYSGVVASTVLNNAIISANTAGGAIIYVKGGTYTITTPLLFADFSDIHIIGEGADNTIFTSAGVGTEYAIIDLRGTDDNIEIAGIKFISTASQATEQNEALIFAGNHDAQSDDWIMNNLWIHNCEFTCPDINMNAVYTDTDEADSRLNRFLFENNYVHNIGRAGVETKGNEVATVKHEGNSFLNNTITDVGLIGEQGMGLSIVGTNKNIKISGNRIKDIRLNQAIELSNCQNCEVTSNIIYDTTYHSTGITLGSVSPLFSSNYITVSDNIIHLGDPDAPATGNTYSQPFLLSNVNYLTMTNNVFRGCHSEIEGAKYGLINNNFFNCLSPYGLNLLDGTQFMKIENNILLGDSSEINGAVFRVYGADCAYNEFINNTFRFPVSSTIFISSTNAHDNICDFSQGIATTSSGSGNSPAIPPGNNYVTVTSGNAAYYVTLPVSSATLIGKKIRGRVGANGFELRVAASQATTVYLNGVTTNVEAAIPASSTFEVECIDATHWILKAWTNLGAVLTAIIPDAV